MTDEQLAVIDAMVREIIKSQAVEDRHRICNELDKLAKYGPRGYVELEAAKIVVGGAPAKYAASTAAVRQALEALIAEQERT